MAYWVVAKDGKDGKGETLIAAATPEDAIRQAEELARNGFQHIRIRDRHQKELALDDMERSLRVRTDRS